MFERKGLTLVMGHASKQTLPLNECGVTLTGIKTNTRLVSSVMRGYACSVMKLSWLPLIAGLFFFF